MSNKQSDILYSDENFRELMVEMKTLSSYEGVASWDSRASSELELMIRVATDLENRISAERAALKQAEQEFLSRPYLSRLFGNRDAETQIQARINKYQGYIAVLRQRAPELQEAVDFTPNSPEEKKLLLQELRVRKKELQLQKRELAATMKSIRASARQKSSEAGLLFGVFYDPKAAAHQRRNIRYNKEAALRPHESEKDAVERQILQVDRDIVWAERF